MADTVQTDTLILGVGNILWADEGFGVRALEHLAAKFTLPPDVCLLDGGTQGLALLPHITACKRLMIFDAVDFDGAPGTLSVVRDEAITGFIGAHAVSLHQTGMQDIMALARFMGWSPLAVTLIGVQPEVLEDYGGSLSDCVRARLEEAVCLALKELEIWNVCAKPNSEDKTCGLMDPALQISPYEGGRPSADAACRNGDERFIIMSGGR